MNVFSSRNCEHIAYVAQEYKKQSQTDLLEGIQKQNKTYDFIFFDVSVCVSCFVLCVFVWQKHKLKKTNTNTNTNKNTNTT